MGQAMLSGMKSEDEGAQRRWVRAPVGAALAAGHRGAGHRPHEGHGQRRGRRR